MAKIKYMGSADVRAIDKGETFGGRLADATTARLEWSRDNNFVVDTDEAGLSADAVALLLTDDNFKDVSDLKRIPLSVNEKIYGGFTEVNDTVQTEPVTGNKSGSAGPSSSGRGTTTTAGGSTSGTVS